MVTLHKTQSAVFKEALLLDNKRFTAVCCSRGWGKSYVAAVIGVTAAYELLHLPKHIPNKYVYIIAPTYQDVVDIYYPLLAFDLGLEERCTSISKQSGQFIFANGTEIRLLSYEAIERIRGRGAYFVIWDEVSSCKKGIAPQEAWEGSVLPAITSRWSQLRVDMIKQNHPQEGAGLKAGRALFISTPKGYNYFHKLCMNHESDSAWGYFTFDYTHSPYLDPEEILRLKASMDPITFASEYLALFKESGNSVFYCFDRAIHVRKDLEDLGEEEDVHIAIDFNVALQCSAVFVVRGGQMHFIDQFKGHPDTEELAKAIVGRYKNGKRKVYSYPDPSGRARKTSSPVGRTDFSILESHGIHTLAHSKAPPIVDSVQAVNRMLKNANGDTNLYVHPRCNDVILSLERTRWLDNNQDTASIDKSEGVEHFSDGVRYACEYLYPVRSGVKSTSRGRRF
jgi:hypothetical protein